MREVSKLTLFFILIFAAQSFPQLNSWEEIDQNHNDGAFIDDKSNIYLARYPSIYKSQDLGETWSIIYTTQYTSSSFYFNFWVDTNYTPFNRIIVKENDPEVPILISDDDGLNWNSLNTPLPPKRYTFTTFGDILVNVDSNIYRSSNGGINWTIIPGIPGNYDLAVDIFNNIYTAHFYTVWDPNYGTWYFETVYKSTNNGNTWNYIKTSSGDSYSGFELITTTSGDLFLGDYGINWTYRYRPNGTSDTYHLMLTSAFVLDSDRIIGTGLSQVLFSDDDGANWQNIDDGINGNGITGIDSLGYVYVISSSGFYRSNFTWFQLFDKDSLYFENVAVNDTSFSNIFFKNKYNFDITIDSLYCSDENFFINSISSLFIPAGDSINIQLGFHPEVFGYFDGLLELYSPVINARILLKGQSPYPVLTPLNEQIIFNQTIIDSTSFKSFKFINSSPSNDLRIDTLYLLIGENFSIISDNLPLIISPSDTGEILLAFTPHTVGLKKDTLVICSNTEVNKYYFSLGGRGINPSGLISDDVINYDNILFQNYPNPFNPITNIQFSIKSQQNVSLIVFDVLGNEVITLVDEEKPAGQYSVNFDGTKLSSGIYFYQLKAGDYTATKKLILLK